MNRFEFYGNLQIYKRNSEELKHYGTIGQKWGVRKWQNPDGTFNEAGKERYFGTKKKSSGSDDEKKNSKSVDIKWNIHPSMKQYEKEIDEEAARVLKNIIEHNPNHDVPSSMTFTVGEDGKFHADFKYDEPKYDKLGKFTLLPSVSKKMFDFGINNQRNALDWESTKQSSKNFADSIKENRDMYDAKNLTDEEIDDIVMNRMKTHTSETAAAEFNTQSLRYQLEKALNTKFGSLGKNSKSNESDYNNILEQGKLGSISKPKIKAKYLNEDGTLNEEGKARVHTKANASATASAVFKIFKWLKIAGMPISAISGISLAAMGAPATLVVAALAGLGIQGLSATGDHIISKKLENRSSNYYKMLNGGNVNE